VLSGTPLQTSKRVVAEWLLLFTYLVNLFQFGGTCKNLSSPILSTQELEIAEWG
jgi:hypothetical protein